jgi:hypothetical protein
VLTLDNQRRKVIIFRYASQALEHIPTFGDPIAAFRRSIAFIFSGCLIALSFSELGRKREAVTGCDGAAGVFPSGFVFGRCLDVVFVSHACSPMSEMKNN